MSWPLPLAPACDPFAERPPPASPDEPSRCLVGVFRVREHSSPRSNLVFAADWADSRSDREAGELCNSSTETRRPSLGPPSAPANGGISASLPRPSPSPRTSSSIGAAVKFNHNKKRMVLEYLSVGG